MKNTKRRMENLNLYDYRHVEDHLSAMAARGWRLESIGARLWKYRRAEPAKVRYAVTYIQDASQFNPGPTERQQTLEELCAAAGWEKVADWFQMQIYCSEAENPIPLETEESVRLEAVHRSMKRNFLPANIICLLVSLVMLGRFVRTLITDPIHILESDASLFTGPLFLLLTAILLISLLHYWLWYCRSAKSVAQGGSCAAPGDIRWVSWVGYALLIPWTALYCLSWLARGLPGPAVYFALHTLIICLMILLLRKTTALLRRMKASFRLNLFLTLLADVVLAAVLVGGLNTAAIKGGWFNGARSETYIYQDQEWDVSPMDLPLTVSDLTGETYSHISRQDTSAGSVLLPRRVCREHVMEGTARKGIHYEITKPRGWLYDMAVKSAAASREETFSYRTARFSWLYTWEEIPAAPWGAERACRELCDGEFTDTVLLIVPDRLVEFECSLDLTPEQMALVGEELKNA